MDLFLPHQHMFQNSSHAVLLSLLVPYAETLGQEPCGARQACGGRHSLPCEALGSQNTYLITWNHWFSHQRRGQQWFEICFSVQIFQKVIRDFQFKLCTAGQHRLERRIYLQIWKSGVLQDRNSCICRKPCAKPVFLVSWEGKVSTKSIKCWVLTEALANMLENWSGGSGLDMVCSPLLQNRASCREYSP